jgi:5-methylcytosine-specific restriction endonuclease McrA
MLNKKGDNMKHKCGQDYLFERLLKKDKRRCCGCGFKHGKWGMQLEADHVYTRSQLKKEGREDEINFNNKNFHNFQLLCRTCNVMKGNVCFDARYRLKNFKGRLSEKTVIKNKLDFATLIGRIKENA